MFYQRLISAKEGLQRWRCCCDATFIDNSFNHVVTQVDVRAVHRIENTDRKAFSTRA